MESKKYVPAQELADYEDGQLVWRVNFPDYAPVENLGIHTKRLGRLARLAGFESLRFESYGGDTTKTVPGIDSVGIDGSATASNSAAVMKADVQQSHVNPDNSEAMDEWTWTNGTVKLNIDEIDNRVGESGKNVRNPKIWTKELNGAMTAGIIGAAQNNLVKRPNRIDKLRAPGIILISTALNSLTGDGGFDKPLHQWIVDIEQFQLIADPFLVGLVFKHSIKQRRWSLVPGVQLDRLATVYGVSKAMPLVKNI